MGLKAAYRGVIAVGGPSSNLYCSKLNRFFDSSAAEPNAGKLASDMASLASGGNGTCSALGVVESAPYISAGVCNAAVSAFPRLEEW